MQPSRLARANRGCADQCPGNCSSAGVGEARPPEFAALAAEFQRCYEGLTALGVSVKDVDSGLLDVPSIRNGEDVLLCWRLGEPAVEWWHGVDDGLAGRRPVDWDDE